MDTDKLDSDFDPCFSVFFRVPTIRLRLEAALCLAMCSIRAILLAGKEGCDGGMQPADRE
jgi:hypothetical protein